MKRIIPVVIVIALVALAGYYAWTSFGKAGNAADALGGSGTIETDQISITPQTTGRIVEAPAEEGVAVKKGDVLYRLDASLLDLQVQQAQAGVDAAQANYDQVRAKDSSKSSDIKAAKAQLDQARVALKMAKVQAGYAVVVSPIDGIVSSVVAKTGENAVPGSTLAIVSDTSKLTVTIFVPESRIGQVVVGQSGAVTTDSLAKTYHGDVVFIATQAEFTPASIETRDQRVKLVYQVRLRITDADSSLKPGMPADVVLQ